MTAQYEHLLRKSRDAKRPPAICGSETFAMEVSSSSMKVARVTVRVTIHGLTTGRDPGVTIGFDSV
jgi:hypothetical protein